jgi:hypothetical protein
MISCHPERGLKDNLIANPGFEIIDASSPVGWEVTTSDNTRIFQASLSDQSHTGNKAMTFGRVWAEEWEMNGIKVDTPLIVNPNNRYILSFWYKTIDIQEYPLPLMVRLNVYRHTEKPLRYNKNISTRDEWTQIRWLIDTLPPDAYEADIGFFLWIRTKGKVILDDVEFKIADPTDIQNFDTWRTLPEPDLTGDYDKTTFSPTGFYNVKKNGERWWLVDPKGNPTWAIATMGEIPGLSGNGNIHLTQWFKDNYESNRLEYAKMQYELLETWGLNSFAGWTVDEYAILTEERYNNSMTWFPLYRVLNFSIMGPDKNYYAKNSKGEAKGVHDHSFPDPFNPEWRDDARKRARERIEQYKGKHWFAGWFMDNEIDYGSLYAYIWGDYSAVEFIKYLEKKYVDIDTLNKSWSSDFGHYNYASFNDILLYKPSPVEWDDPLYPDFVEFERMMMEEYINYTYNIVKEMDPDHLIISNRLNLDPMGSLYRTIDLWSRYDIVCVNIYPENLFFGFSKGELELFEWINKKTGKPIIIGEWSIPATDSELYDFGQDPLGRSLDWSWPQVVKDQKERAKAYRTCMMQLASKPYILGAAWFKVLDVNSSTRRANRGLINDDHQPYDDFIEVFQSTNLELKEKMGLN